MSWSKVKKEENFGEDNRKYNRERPQYKLGLQLFDLLQLSPQKKIVDIGAGMGEFADILSEKGFKVVCIDGADNCYRELIKKGYETYKIDLETQKLPFSDNSFDLVISLEVIEHIWNTKNYLSEIRRILIPNGYAIFTTPNYNHWMFRLQHLVGNFEKFTYGSRHKKFYTVKSIRKELERFFKVQKIVGRIVLPKLQFNSKYFMNFLCLHVGLLCKNDK